MSLWQRLLAILAAGREAPPAALLSASLLRELNAAEAEAWAPILSAACAAAEINTPRRLAAFLGNVLHETGGLRKLREGLDYSPAGLARTWPGRFAVPPPEGSRVDDPPIPNARALELGRREGPGGWAARQVLIAEAAYGGRMGNRLGTDDAWRFRGAGLLQLTGRDNWERQAAALGVTLEELEARLVTRQGAARSAGDFWRVMGCNPLADAWNLRDLRRRINGGTIGLGQVEHIAELALAILRPPPRPTLA